MLVLIVLLLIKLLTVCMGLIASTELRPTVLLLQLLLLLLFLLLFLLLMFFPAEASAPSPGSSDAPSHQFTLRSLKKGFSFMKIF